MPLETPRRRDAREASRAVDGRRLSTTTIERARATEDGATSTPLDDGATGDRANERDGTRRDERDEQFLRRASHAFAAASVERATREREHVRFVAMRSSSASATLRVRAFGSDVSFDASASASASASEDEDERVCAYELQRRFSTSWTSNFDARAGVRALKTCEREANENEAFVAIDVTLGTWIARESVSNDSESSAFDSHELGDERRAHEGEDERRAHEGEGEDEGECAKEAKERALAEALAVNDLEASLRRAFTTRYKNDESTTFTLTVAALNKPAVLCRVTRALDRCGLDVIEAHALCSDDGYALDVFVVRGWKSTAEVLQAQMEELLNGNGTKNERRDDARDGDVEMSILSRAPLAERQVGNAHRINALALYGIGAPEGKLGDCSKMLVSDISFDSDIREEELSIGRQIGSGAFGTLHHGVFTQRTHTGDPNSVEAQIIEREVAVKFLTINSENENTARRDFYQEVAVLKVLKHANVLAYVGSITHGARLCLVTEYMRNGPLLKHLHATGVPTQAEAIKIALCVAQGMAYIHDMRLVHRDLKAANVLLSETGVAKICDFGLARNVPDDGSVMTAETGTYRWMAPEVIAHMPYACSCDVFSYGILLWELMTAGMIPYEDLNPLQAAVAVVQKGVRPIVPATSSELFATLMKQCWLTVPESRPMFSTIVEMLRMASSAKDQTGKFSFLERFKIRSSTKKSRS